MLEMVQRRRRAVGAGLTAYGLTGLAAGILVVAATIAVGLGMEPALAAVDRQRDAVVASLESSAAALAKTAVLVDDAGGAVQSSSGIVSEAANVSRLFAGTLTRLADTFGIFSVLGNQPFAPLASDATQLASQLGGIATDLDALGTRLGSISRSLPPLTADIQATSTQLATVAAELSALEVPESAAAAFGWLVVGLVILVAWLLVPAFVALVAGVALLRRPPGAA